MLKARWRFPKTLHSRKICCIFLKHSGKSSHYRILKAIWKMCHTIMKEEFRVKASHKLPPSLHFSQNGIFMQLSKWDWRRWWWWWTFTPIGCKQLWKKRPAGWARPIYQASSIKSWFVRPSLPLLSKSSFSQYPIGCWHINWQFCQSLRINILHIS